MVEQSAEELFHRLIKSGIITLPKGYSYPRRWINTLFDLSDEERQLIERLRGKTYNESIKIIEREIRRYEKLLEKINRQFADIYEKGDRFSTLKKLEEHGLVRVDMNALTVHLTEKGREVMKELRTSRYKNVMKKLDGRYLVDAHTYLYRYLQDADDLLSEIKKSEEEPVDVSGVPEPEIVMSSERSVLDLDKYPKGVHRLLSLYILGKLHEEGKIDRDIMLRILEGDADLFKNVLTRYERSVKIRYLYDEPEKLTLFLRRVTRIIKEFYHPDGHHHIAVSTNRCPSCGSFVKKSGKYLICDKCGERYRTEYLRPPHEIRPRVIFGFYPHVANPEYVHLLPFFVTGQTSNNRLHMVTNNKHPLVKFMAREGMVKR